MSRETHAQNTLGSVYDKIKQAKVLMVGAGGIGCELLKDLVLVGFNEVHIVDLDTIDLSNLNRQFLFGHEHIKKSKAMVAKETASKFNPNVNIVPYHDNIKDTKFDVKWFKQFDIVFNALDNMDARRHVNRICLASDVPLIESGTTGFHGQVSVIINGKTECYDCTPKLTPKSFPVCTIRSTPSQPVHNIVWAKSYLFSQLFDEQEDASMEDDSGADNAEERKNMQQEVNELKELRQAIMDADAFDKLVNKIFDTDIERLVAMESMWTTRKPPTPLKYAEVSQKVDDLDGSQIQSDDQKTWTVEEDLAVLKSSLSRLQQRIKAGEVLSFDKDDNDTLDFVVASANIRSSIFGIDMKSKFECKQIAGNIIPAVATINAMIAGVCVMQSFKILQNKVDDLQFVFIANDPTKVFINDKLNGPNPHCVVSGIDRGTLQVDLETYTMGDLVKELTELKYSAELSIITDQLLYDPDFDDNLDKPLKQLGICHGSFITAVDEDDETNHVNLELNVEAATSSPEGITNLPKEFRTKPPKKPEAEDSDEDNGAIVEEPSSGDKRTHTQVADGEVESNGSMAKRAKTEEANESDGVVVIDDDDDIIEID